MIDIFMPYSSIKNQTTEQHNEFYCNYNKQLFLLLGVIHSVDPVDLISDFKEKKSHWMLKSGALSLISYLRQRNYHIGIISNFDARLNEVVYQHLGLSGMVDYLHISQIEGLEKPNPLFYRSFLERYEISIAKSFYVGDSYLLDFLPATNLGLRTWLLDEADLYSKTSWTIKNLSEVIDRLSE
jgi:HAD superfamily hydrolase (TIGR01549 family)